MGLRFNRTAELSEWSPERLHERIAELSADFPPADLGFNDAELQALLDALQPPEPKAPKAKREFEADAGGVFKIVVKCDGEEHQAAALEWLNAHGYDAKALVG